MVSLIDSVWWRADINFAERRPFARIAMSGSLSFCGALERFAGRATLLPLGCRGAKIRAVGAALDELLRQLGIDDGGGGGGEATAPAAVTGAAIVHDYTLHVIIFFI